MSTHDGIHRCYGGNMTGFHRRQFAHQQVPLIGYGCNYAEDTADFEATQKPVCNNRYMQSCHFACTVMQLQISQHFWRPLYIGVPRIKLSIQVLAPIKRLQSTKNATPSQKGYIFLHEQISVRRSSSSFTCSRNFFLFTVQRHLIC